MTRSERATIRCLALVAGCMLSAVSASVGHAQTYSLVIGVDGLGAYGFEAANTFNMHAIKDGSWASGYHGAYSLTAFAGGTVGTPTEQPTVSGPGWSTIQTGVWKNDHGVIDNAATFTNGNFIAFPSYLKLIESQFNAGVRTSGIVAWNAIDTNIFATAGLDSRTETSGDDAAVATAAVTQLSGFPSGSRGAMFAYFGDVDHAGHAYGAYSAEYHAAASTVDTRVGQLLAAIRSRSNFANENWQILLVADHGHKPTGGHGGQSALERNIPLLISSKIVSAGPISASVVPPSQIDVATTVLAHFGVTPPAYMLGESRSQNTDPLATSNLATGLVTHLSFDGNANASHAGNGGTVIGNVQFVPGRFGQAARVSTYGSGSVQLNDDLGAMIGLRSDFAVSMWVKYDAATSTPAFFSNKNAASPANTGVNLAYQPNSGQGGLDANFRSNFGSSADVQPFSGFEPGTWHNVVLNVDRDDTTSVYVDGAVYGASSTVAGLLDGQFNFRLFNDGTGSDAAGAGFTNLTIDEFSAWNRLLSNDEIAFLSTSAIPDSIGLAGDYNHDGVVDAADYVVWRNGLDSIYTQNDYDIWRNNFNKGGIAATGATAVDSTTAVPEPAAATMLISTAITLLIARRKRNDINRRRQHSTPPATTAP